MKTEIAEIRLDLRLGDSEYASERNKKILKMLSEDKRPKEIAGELVVSVATIRWCIEWLRNKNNFHSIAALVSAAIRADII